MVIVCAHLSGFNYVSYYCADIIIAVVGILVIMLLAVGGGLILYFGLVTYLVIHISKLFDMTSPPAYIGKMPSFFCERSNINLYDLRL